VNPGQFGGVEKEVATMISAGGERLYVETFVSDQKRVFEQYLSVLEDLVSQTPNRHFRIRPHPFESPNIYKRRFSRFANVSINGDGTVIAALHNATCAIHLNCGSAVEAAMMGKLPIQLEFLNNPIQRTNAPLPSRLSVLVQSLSELVEIVSKNPVVSSFNLSEAVSKELTPYFGPLDGKAAGRVADFICGYMNSTLGACRRNWFISAVRAGRRNPTTGQLVQGLMGAILGSAVTERIREGLRPARRAKRVNGDAVDSILMQLNNCDPGVPWSARRAAHPWSRLPLESIFIETQRKDYQCK
jgi:hypothetical protein